MAKKSETHSGIVHIDIKKIDNINKPSSFDLDCFPVLPTRNLVLFPGVVSPIKIGRQQSLSTVKTAEEKSIPIAIFCQKDPADNQPEIDDLYNIGVIAQVIKVLELPDGTTSALVSAIDKCQILAPAPPTNDFTLNASIKVIRESLPRVESTRQKFELLANEAKNITINLAEATSDNDGPVELLMNLRNSESPQEIVNLISTHFPESPSIKYELLKENSLTKRASMLLETLVRHEEMLKIARKVHESAKESFDEQQRRAFLQRQMEAIDHELNGDDSETSKLEQRAQSLNLPDNVRELFGKELAKLQRNNPQSPDYAVQYAYLETLLDLPWGQYSEGQSSLTDASDILDSQHFGLEKVKERIVEQVALLINNPDGKSPIICLVGPPGVGKTSLGKSVAESLGRKFQRISLGGLHDEAEIRGHRRTYIGAMPGRIIDAIKRAGSCNPVLMLDEIDKIGKDYKGDPEAALLEVLDPEQNCKFHDNYIDVDFDLSKVLFIATANNISNLSRPLLDRMEIIDLAGYIPEEKIEIARRHLLPKVLDELSLPADEFSISDEALLAIINDYTAESGVRQLEKALRSIIRKIIVSRLKGQSYPKPIVPENLKDLLGAKIYSREKLTNDNYVGVATGLAWTAAGGEILFIESSISQSKAEKLTLTGNLGDVMKESATIALQYIRSHAKDFGIDPTVFDTSHLHIHVPEGAVPKDGPSAGITLATSILSAFTEKTVRTHLAMTGELTLRGKVLPVGGIKEKILAAKRAGITDIILCEDNKKDIEEIPSLYLNGLNFHYVTDVKEVFAIAFRETAI